MTHFDVTPVGRIVNRFAQDIAVIDTQIPSILHRFMHCALELLCLAIIMSYTAPRVIGLFLPIAVFYFFVQVAHYLLPNLSEEMEPWQAWYQWVSARKM